MAQQDGEGHTRDTSRALKGQHRAMVWEPRVFIQIALPLGRAQGREDTSSLGDSMPTITNRKHLCGVVTTSPKSPPGPSAAPPCRSTLQARGSTAGVSGSSLGTAWIPLDL